ncbi:MAG TPA: hypothetical protein VMS17_32775, partial [Gemmataceae bacterium]|nr:hypothetical protein [Gemmataceae bacterium]
EDKKPVFSDAPWKWLRIQSEMEEWQEGLRTLYVACTRARDYLILSSSLPDDYQPAGPWMQTLAGRFDLETGRCVAPDVAEARRPAVGVYDRLHPLPPAPNPPPEREPAAPPPLVERPDAFAELIRPMPPKYVAVANLTDRPPPGPAERMVRSVLEIWDFRDPGGWRSPLRRFAAEGDFGEVETILQRFANSELRRRLAEALDCLHEAEYFLNLTRAGIATQETPTIAGRIDCLWREADRRWRLLFFTLTPISAERPWAERLTEMVLAAAALHQQMGKWPAAVALCSLSDGGVIEKAPGRLAHRRILIGAAELLHGAAAAQSRT